MTEIGMKIRSTVGQNTSLGLHSEILMNLEGGGYILVLYSRGVITYDNFIALQ